MALYLSAAISKNTIQENFSEKLTGKEESLSFSQLHKFHGTNAQAITWWILWRNDDGEAFADAGLSLTIDWSEDHKMTLQEQNRGNPDVDYWRKGELTHMKITSKKYSMRVAQKCRYI